MPRKTSEKVSVKYMFEDSDYRNLSCELSEALNGKRAAEGSLSAVSKQIRAEIAEYDAKVQGLGSKLQSGYEYREVDCTITYDFTKKVKEWKRVDTGTVVKTGTISEEEAQEELALQEQATENHE